LEESLKKGPDFEKYAIAPFQAAAKRLRLEYPPDKFERGQRSPQIREGCTARHEFAVGAANVKACKRLVLRKARNDF
jgi:hypothetical protein